jgi:hypothetical protein
MRDGWGGGLLLGLGGWLQRRRAKRAATSLLPADHPQHRELEDDRRSEDQPHEHRREDPDR